MSVDLLGFELRLREAIADAATAYSIPDDLFRAFEERMLKAAMDVVREEQLAAAERGTKWEPDPTFATDVVIGAAAGFLLVTPSWALQPAQGGIA